MKKDNKTRRNQHRCKNPLDDVRAETSKRDPGWGG
jgi:hypothetical protein